MKNTYISLYFFTWFSKDQHLLKTVKCILWRRIICRNREKEGKPAHASAFQGNREFFKRVNTLLLLSEQVGQNQQGTPPPPPQQDSHWEISKRLVE